MTCSVTGRRNALGHFAARAQRSRRVACAFASFADRIGRAASSGDSIQIAWQAWDCAPRHSLHSTAPHSTLHTLHSTLYTPQSTLHFTLRTSHFTFYTPHVTLQTLHCTALAPRSTRLTPHFRLQTLHSTLYIPHSTLHTPHLTLHCTLHTLQATLCTLHSTLYTPHCAFYTPAAFNNFTPYTFHSKPHASHSASAVTSEECIRLLKQYASPKVFASQKVSAAQTVFASQKNVLCDCLHSGSLVGLVLFLCL